MASNSAVHGLDGDVNSRKARKSQHAVSNIGAMTAGKRLQQLLKEQHISPETFADKLGQSRANIYNHFKLARFPIPLYEKIARVLESYNLDPTPFAPPVEAGYEAKDPDELRALLDGIPLQCLENVKTMMGANRATKVALVAMIDMKLELASTAKK